MLSIPSEQSELPACNKINKKKVVNKVKSNIRVQKNDNNDKQFCNFPIETPLLTEIL